MERKRTLTFAAAAVLRTISSNNNTASLTAAVFTADLKRSASRLQYDVFVSSALSQVIETDNCRSFKRMSHI